ncbi:MAG: LysM domain-containing protein [Ferruginibacter sp.]
MKNTFILFFLLPFFSLAQKPTLNIQGSTPNLYLTHTTAPKESFYSIGRLYNISPKEIAPYNKLTLENGLAIGQVIRIPLTTLNFTQVVAVGKDEAVVPLYYHAEAKESLAHISTTHNKIPVATLKKWNKIIAEDAAANADVVVGYLKVNKALSDFTNGKNYVGASVATVPDLVPHAVDKPVEPVPVVTTQAAPVQNEKILETPTKPVIQQNTAELKPVVSISENNAGFFQAAYMKQAKAANPGVKSGSGNIFKSTSGWEDGKYYCLFNQAAAGSIVKITINDRSVYAKVLDAIPDMKQTQNIMLSISNAAAASLGVTETGNFDAVVNY